VHKLGKVANWEHEDVSGDSSLWWWRTAMFDKWKWRRLCLTRFMKISGKFVP